MAHYAKTQRIQCHYGEAKPDCPICQGTGKMHPIESEPEFALPCQCRLEGMTFDKPVDELMLVDVEPLPDGGAKVRLEKVDQSTN